jgi:hypothetical protein
MFGAVRGQGCPSIPFEPARHSSDSVVCAQYSPEIMVSEAPAQYRASLQKIFSFTRFNRMQVSPLNFEALGVNKKKIECKYCQSQMIEKTLLCDSSIILAAPTGSG